MKNKNLTSRFTKSFQVTATLILVFGLLFLSQSCSKDDDVKPGDAAIISFKIGDVTATIDETAKTITVELLAGSDITAVVPTIIVSEGATINPASDVATDFTNAVTYTVTDKSGTVKNMYTATITSAELRKLAFIGNAAENTEASWSATFGTDYDLMDDRTAAEWFEATMKSSTTDVTYFSFEEVAMGADLSEFHAIWIQYDGGTWGGVVASFPNNGEGKHCLLGETGVAWELTCDDLVSDFVNAVKTYYEAGGNILLGNYAGSMVDELGVVTSADLAPNNSWGGVAVDDGATASEWMVHWAGDQNSPIFKDIILGSSDDIPAPAFVMIEAGGEKKNRSNQYNLNFGPWAPNGDTDPLADRTASFKELTGAQILIENGGKNEPQMVLWEATGSKGAVIAILGGTYDWYIGETLSGSDRNLKTLTKNSLNYLVDLAMEE